MELRKVYITSYTSGVTFVEVIVSMALIVFLALMAIPPFLDWYRSSSVITERDTLWSVLALARTYAETNRHGQPAGVFMATHSYTLFSGNTYIDTDSQNINFPVDSSVILAATQNPILFANISVMATGSLVTLTAGQKTASINVNTEGFIQ